MEPRLVSAVAPPEEADRAAVFISYARTDKDFVLHLAEALQLKGIAVCGDWQLVRGENYQNQLDDLMLSADALIFVISPDSLHSAPCNSELDSAAKQNKRILPLLHRDPGSQKKDLPESLSLPQWSFLRAEDDFVAGIQGLVEALNTDFQLMPEHRRLLQAAEIWRRNNHGASYLLRKDSLQRAQDWRARTLQRPDKLPKPTSLQLEYIRASEFARTHGSRIRLAIVGIIAVAMSALAVVATFQRNKAVKETAIAAAQTREANQQKDNAKDQARIAQEQTRIAQEQETIANQQRSEAERQLANSNSRSLAAQAEELLPRNQSAALNLALEGWRVAKTREASVAINNTWPVSSVVLEHEGRVYQATFSPDGQRIVTASADTTARVWNASSEQLLATLKHEAEVNQAAFSPDGQRIVTASDDRTARVWNASSGQLLATLKHEAKVNQAAFSPDGQRIVTASDDRTARLWEVSSSQLLATLKHDGAVNQAAFSPDGQRILTTCEDDDQDDKTVLVWNVSSGQLLVTLKHDAVVNQAAFSPDGQRIVTASSDGAARVWNASSGQLLATLKEQDTPVWQAAFSPDGQRIVTAGFDGAARVWEIVTLSDLQKILAR